MNEELQQFVDRMQQAAGDNLESIVLYGSAARDDFSEHYSDINLLCVLRQAGGAALDQVAPVVRWWSGELQFRPPIFQTAEELRNSADVFAIEMLDLKASHRVLAGRDLLAAIDVPMNLHRVQLEHELRTAVLKLRHHYLLARGNEDDLKAVLAKSVSSIIVLLRHALIALGHPAASLGKREILARVGEIFGADPAPVSAALDIREQRRIELPAIQLYHRYLDFVSSIAARIDQAAPKREWQRVTRPGEMQ